MKLVIAEKPSVAMSLAAVLGATERKDGYLEGSGYLVSWCVGHLLELAQPEAYKEQYAKWRYEDLPILPENWKYEVPKDKKTQLALLCRLMKDKRVDSVVCATDAGREGELIFRLVYEYAGCKKPMERLWISSMEDAAIREGFDHLHPGSDYDKLYDAAVCRAGADWLIGINATRLFSVLYGVTLNVGRVMSPTLALLVQRESDIESFISKPFYVPEITCRGFTASGEKMTERSEAEKIRMDCDHNSAFVRSVEKQVKTIQPPRLYDLTTLQRECNRIYGYVFMVPVFVLYFLWLKKLGRTQSFLHTAAVFVFGYYLFGLLTVTGIGFTSTMTFRPNISWTPFIGMITGPIDTILNIILFVPLGFFLPLLYKKYHHMKTVALTGFLFSLAVEIVQMFGWGSSDINDLMTNTAGACIGFLVYCLLSRILPANLKKQLQSSRVNAVAEVLLFAICTFAIMVTAQTWFVHDVLNVP